MPLADLLQRVGAAVDTRLLTEGEDVADQKIDLFVKDLPVVAILAAIMDLLNSDGPRGYRWERSGRRPSYRYALVRDVASRQWEARRNSEADARVIGLLRERLQVLRREPFRSDPARPNELPAMRKLLTSLSAAEVAQLAANGFLRMSPAACEPGQSAILKELTDQTIDAGLRERPETMSRAMAEFTPAELVARTKVDIRLNRDPVRNVVRVGIRTPVGGPISEVCSVLDPAAAARRDRGERPGAALPAAEEDPVLTLPTRERWSMGDLLAEIAARARVNLIADDYSLSWQSLARVAGPRALSTWLAAIRDQEGFEPVRAGAIWRLRNRRWWYHRPREVPPRLLKRWAASLAGSADARLEAVGEMARWAPLSVGAVDARDGIQALWDSPELAARPWQVAGAVSRAQSELVMFSMLPAAQQESVRGAGLRLTWETMPPAMRTVFARRVQLFLEPGISDAQVRRSAVFLQFGDERLRVRYELDGFPSGGPLAMATSLAWDGPGSSPGLLGRSLPEIEVEDATGKVSRRRLTGPLLLYVSPAWPRPVVARREEFADLHALQALSASSSKADRQVLVLGAGARAVELRDLWKDRGLSLTPAALTAASGISLGVRYEPVAIVVDQSGRVGWAKEGYAPGDEGEWRRQLALAGAASDSVPGTEAPP